jgi:hypothetical protein
MLRGDQESKSGLIFIIVAAGFVYLGLNFSNCARTRPHSSIAQYQFSFKNETYRIRSIFNIENNERYNELIGKNFLAIDFDQDRILDRITIGQMALSTAQEVYDYGLEMLTKENRLKELNPTNHKYTRENTEVFMEFKSFYPPEGKPFNQFKIISKKQMVNPETIVAIDNEADGILDELLKGKGDLSKIQSEYTALIEDGLRENKLIKRDGMILAKN